MTLTRSLTIPLVNPLVSPLGGDAQAIIDAKESLVVKYPLKSDLSSDPAGSQGVLTSSQKIYKDASGKWVVADPNSPAVTGLSTLLEGASTNKCTNYNFAPDAGLSGITDFANMTTVRILDPDGLKEAGFFDLVNKGTSNGYYFSSTSSDTSVVRGVGIDGIVGNTNNHSCRVFVRSKLGGDFSISNGSVDFLTVSLDAGVWTEVKAEDWTPALAGNKLFLRVSPLDTIDWFGNQLEEHPVVTSPIVVSGSSATRLADDLQLPTTGWPVNDCTLFFCGYNLRDIGSNQTLFESNNIRIYFDDSSNHFIADVGGSQSIINGFGGQNCVALQVDSSNNMTLLLGSQTGNTVSLGAPLSWGATAQLANNLTLSESADGFYYDVKVFDSLVSIDNAVWA